MRDVKTFSVYVLTFSLLLLFGCNKDEDYAKIIEGKYIGVLNLSTGVPTADDKPIAENIEISIKRKFSNKVNLSLDKSFECEIPDVGVIKIPSEILCLCSVSLKDNKYYFDGKTEITIPDTPNLQDVPNNPFAGQKIKTEISGFVTKENKATIDITLQSIIKTVFTGEKKKE